MYTIVFFDGSYRHIRDEQAAVLMRDIANGQKQIVIDRSMLVLSSIARVDETELWMGEQGTIAEEKGKTLCIFGYRHSDDRDCDCVKIGRVPVLLSDAQEEIERLDAANTLHSIPPVADYIERIVTAHPSLRISLSSPPPTQS